MSKVPNPPKYDKKIAYSCLQRLRSAAEESTEARAQYAFVEKCWLESRYWDYLKYRWPKGPLTREEGWHALFSFRDHKAIDTGFPTTVQLDGALKRLCYSLSPAVAKKLHHIDIHRSGMSFVGQIENSVLKKEYGVRSLMEEAITSSLLEGAGTTRKAALEILQKKHRPKSHAEKMVINNYQAMEFIKTAVDAPLSMELIRNIHALVTKDTLSEKDKDRFRTDNEDIVIVGNRPDDILYEPPPIDLALKAVKNMIENLEDGSAQWVHPVIKGALIHYIIEETHIFPDGNGRTGRALFYWHMLKSGYTIFEYLSISSVIRKDKNKYLEAFQKVEKDVGLFDYFLDYKLDVILKAIEGFITFFNKNQSPAKGIDPRKLLSLSLNHRQLKIISMAIDDAEKRFERSELAGQFQVSLQTIKSDMEKLVSMNLMEQFIIGKKLVYIKGKEIDKLVAS